MPLAVITGGVVQELPMMYSVYATPEPMPEPPASLAMKVTVTSLLVQVPMPFAVTTSAGGIDPEAIVLGAMLSTTTP